MDNGTGTTGLRAHNVLATFPDRGTAEQAVTELRERAAIPPDRVIVTTKGDEPAVSSAEVRDELEGVIASPVLGAAMTETQAQGAAGGMVLFGIIGAIVGLGIAFLWAGGLPGTTGQSARAFWGALIAFTVAGGTLGMLAGGINKQRFKPSPRDQAAYEDEHVRKPAGPAPKTDQQPVVEVRTDDPAEFRDAVGVLGSLHPIRLDTVDAQGRVLSTKEVGPGRSDAGGPAPGRQDV